MVPVSELVFSHNKRKEDASDWKEEGILPVKQLANNRTLFSWLRSPSDEGSDEVNDYSNIDISVRPRISPYDVGIDPTQLL